MTAAALSKLQSDAYRAQNDDSTYDDWRQNMMKYPTFQFWDLILKYERLILIFIRAHRERNFRVYVDVLEELVPMFFALDHINYARWLPIHIRDMKVLPLTIKEQFEEKHHWVLPKTRNRFSTIPFDQAHEQENKIIKGSGGAIGLTENPTAFRYFICLEWILLVHSLVLL